MKSVNLNAFANTPRYDYLPDGWRYTDGKTAPSGFAWADNRKSRFKPGYQRALVKIERD